MLPPDHSLRLANEADLPAIVEIYNSIIAGRMVTADLSPVSVETRKPWFEAHDPERRPIWVVEKGSKVIAWFSFDTFMARAAYDATVMIALYIAEEFRGKGLGRSLLDLAEKEAKKRQISCLLGYIFGHNIPSLRLFERMGYEQWARLPGIAQLETQRRDLIIMGKHLRD